MAVPQNARTGSIYVQKVCQGEDCLEPCPRKNNNHTETKWCESYTFETVGEEEELGYIPLTYHCHDRTGKVTEEIDTAVAYWNSARSGNIGNCVYLDGATLVDRKNESGPYAYCGGSGQECNNIFTGGFLSTDFDPRYRPWYMQTKENQLPTWSDPYNFQDRDRYGITYSRPVYRTIPESGKSVFRGAVAIDFTRK